MRCRKDCRVLCDIAYRLFRAHAKTENNNATTYARLSLLSLSLFHVGYCDVLFVRYTGQGLLIARKIERFTIASCSALNRVFQPSISSLRARYLSILILNIEIMAVDVGLAQYRADLAPATTSYAMTPMVTGRKVDPRKHALLSRIEKQESSYHELVLIQPSLCKLTRALSALGSTEKG